MGTPDSGLVKTSLPETKTLRFLNSGKVRDLYEVQDTTTGDEYLLFVATDRISAFDVILNNGVPGKGKLLTQLSVFWFDKLSHVVENHVVASTLDRLPAGVRAQVEPYWADQLEGRTMLVRKAKVVKLEAIVRGYLTGSAWSEYKKNGTVHGISLRKGYVESDKFDEPLFTPSTKADQGEHDENISPERAKTIVGAEVYEHVARTALSLYKDASAYALTRGLILADTKFEFGLLPIIPDAAAPSSSSPSPIITVDSKPHKLILIDEALTPDSSRYWSANAYTPGKPQASYDKQYLRDWLLSEGFRKGFESGRPGEEGKGWAMTEAVVEGTKERYETAVRVLTTSKD